MSRRTKWRSRIEIIIGLLKNFLKTSKEKRSLDLWLYGCINYLLPGSSLELGLWSSLAEAHWRQAGPRSRARWGLPTAIKPVMEFPRSWGPEGKTCRQESLVRYSAAPQTPQQGESSLPKTPQLILPPRFPKQQRHGGREPGKRGVDEVPKEELTSLGF